MLAEELKKRGLIHDKTEGLEEFLETKPTFYIGVDPTADSLHIGHLIGIITAKRLSDYGLKPIIIVGGGTGRIGDPKPDAERTLLSPTQIRKNKKALEKQISKLMGKKVKLVDNYKWLGKIKLIDFLRDIGKHFTVNNLIKKDAIAERLKSDIGLSYTEFAYPLLQAYDFLYLFENQNCKLQIGGSDQWGNIVAGIELIRKKTGQTAYAFTFPLLIDKQTGKKFGKSEGNPIWLDPKKTSPFKFYQFLINTPDELAIELLYKLTFLPIEKIKEIEKEFQKDKKTRLAQKTLAYELTSFVHSQKIADEVKLASEILFDKREMEALEKIPKQVKDILKEESPSFSFKKLPSKKIIDVLKTVGLASSGNQARELISSGAVRILNVKITDENFEIKESDFTNGLLIIRKGKRDLALIYLD